MTYPVPNLVYPIANAVAKTRVFITVFETRNPTVNDINYDITQRWFNTALNEEWILVSFSTVNEVTTANWQPIASSLTTEFLEGNSGGPVGPNGANTIFVVGDNASGINVVGTPLTNTLTIFNANGLPVVGFTVDAFTAPGTNPVLPASNALVTITGAQVAAGTTTNVIRTDSLAANSFRIEVQRSQAVASSTIGDNGVCHFNSAQFTVDSNGFVSLAGGGTVFSVLVDASTPPGTNPVVPNGSGEITITGGQVAAGTTTNVIRTDSLAANTFTIQIQRSQAVASSTIGDNGVSHFNSAQFTVDANGFVSLANTAMLSIAVDASTPPGTNPVLPNGSGQITITGGQVAAGTTANVIRTDSLAANTFTIQIQRSQAVASSTVGDNGVSHFNSAQFSVDSNGFVSVLGSAFISGVIVDAHTAPGTSPVVPNASGNITVTGGQVAAGTTTNVIQTNSLAANTYTVQIQRSQAVASSTVGDNGVSHFNSANFTVDSNGFVSALSQAFNYTTVTGPTTYVVLSTDYYIACDPSGGAITLQFPNAPTFKRLWVIKDRTGNAAINNITLTTPGGTVTFDGLTSYIMNSNYEALNLLANSVPAYEVY